MRAASGPVVVLGEVFPGRTIERSTPMPNPHTPAAAHDRYAAGRSRDRRRTLARTFVLLAMSASVVDTPARASAHADPAVVTSEIETPVLYDDDEGGNASGDDPAIWIHPGDENASIVIVTAKEG